MSCASTPVHTQQRHTQLHKAHTNTHTYIHTYTHRGMADCNINGMNWVCYASQLYYVCMHVCLCVCVCVYVCMSVCMYVCMYVRWCAHVRAQRRVGGGAESQHDLCYILHNVSLSQKSALLCLLVCGGCVLGCVYHHFLCRIKGNTQW